MEFKELQDTYILALTDKFNEVKKMQNNINNVGQSKEERAEGMKSVAAIVQIFADIAPFIALISCIHYKRIFKYVERVQTILKMASTENKYFKDLEDAFKYYPILDNTTSLEERKKEYEERFAKNIELLCEINKQDQ